MTQTADYELLSEAELKQLAQRRRLFESLGFSERDAFDLALSGVSMASARSLILKGCPHHLATKILL